MLVCRPLQLTSAQEAQQDREKPPNDEERMQEGAQPTKPPWWAWVIVGVVVGAAVALACCVCSDGTRSDLCREWCFGLCFGYPGRGGAGDGWLHMRGGGMSAEYTEWIFLTAEEAQRKVVGSEEIAGYITDTSNTTGVFLCKVGGAILTAENGVPKTWTLHLWRTQHSLKSEALAKEDARRERSVSRRNPDEFDSSFISLGGSHRERGTLDGGRRNAVQAETDWRT